jgi:hemoglobin
MRDFEGAAGALFDCSKHDKPGRGATLAAPPGARCTGRRAPRGQGGTAVALGLFMSALPIVAANPNPHFQRLGGEAAVVKLVDAFYRAMDLREDARAIRAMHDADLAQTKAVLRIYLAEWLGGPKRYTAERGQPRLRRVHMPFAIGASARDAWLACMRQALDEIGTEAALRDELLAAFAKVADHLKNTDTDSTHRSP